MDRRCRICSVTIFHGKDYLCSNCRKLVNLELELSHEKEKKIQGILKASLSKEDKKEFFIHRCKDCGIEVLSSHNIEINKCSDCINNEVIDEYTKKRD